MRPPPDDSPLSRHRTDRLVELPRSLADGFHRALTENLTEAKRRYAARARQVVRRLNRLLEDVERAAERFGIDPTAISLSDAYAAVLALQAGMLARAKAYGEAVEEVRRLGDAAMADAGAADLVPAGILADDIEDRDGDASALRGAFAA